MLKERNMSAVMKSVGRTAAAQSLSQGYVIFLKVLIQSKYILADNYSFYS